MHLDLKSNRQGVRDNYFSQLLTRKCGLSSWDLFQRFILLLRTERMNPGHQERADCGQLVGRDLAFCPLVILASADDELDFIDAAQMGQVLPTIPVHLSTAGALQIHDSPHARIYL